MLKLRELELRRGDRALLEQAELTVHSGQKLGLVGANGCGKSSLFALLRGELHPDAGHVEQPPRWVIAHVAQETPALPDPALEYVLDGDAELRMIERELAEAEQAHDGRRIAALHARLEAVDGYSARARAARLLDGLGFAADQHARPVAEFSGGWRVRLNLARALMCRSDLLLLDEPTNHLDLDAVLWLEQWLRGYPGTLLLISHDRDFLDTVVEGIVHIEHRRLHYYSGDYSAFEQRRAARLAQQQAAYRQQQREIARLQQFVDRFRAKATKARQAQSRLKTLDRLERIAPAHVDSPFRFGFRAPEKLPAPLLAITGGTVGYGATPLLERIRLTLQPGTRLGLLGRNGAGKSTLIKLLAGELELQSGERTEGQGLVTGYFAQHQLEQLRADWSPLAHLQQLDPATDAQSHRDFLGGFGFTGDQALAPSGPFSGGEKARLVLALLVWQRPNLLLLDEPTNHLDLEMRHALTLALQDYAGALVLVAHDRHLLRATCDGFLLVHGGRVRDFDGDLEDYRRWLADSGTGTSATGTSATGTSATGTSATGTSGSEPAGRTGSAGERRERRRQEAERRNRLSAERRPLELELRRLEQRLEQLTGERDALEQALAEPALYADDQKSRLQDLLQRQGETRRELDRVEEDWMALQERWEALADEV